METEHSRDRGFTLAELLIVIVILGILSTVTVLAVRSIRAESSEVACGVELDQLVKAQELHRVLNGSYGDEAALVAAGSIKQASALYDSTGDASGYSVSAAAGSSCSGSFNGGAAPPAGPAMTGTAVTFHGTPAWRYPADGGGNDEILVLGRGSAQSDWIAASNAGASTIRRVHFIDMDDLDAGSLSAVLTQMRNNGVTDIAIYLGDDTSNLAGTADTVNAFVQPIAAADPLVTIRTLSPSGFNLQALFGVTG